ncbi:hypothetical protein CPB83DRAFT_366813 [Crepidotus variabilis]|uniref:Uncharacterized protein n=1 Tax=Crepidotus variabilis TaxID=179855 RepID=A0A9P6EFD4_9AGAR|nr:hypothetical protein CPB83DRAFT_366813 [Crepidotus variabilis]
MRRQSRSRSASPSRAAVNADLKEAERKSHKCRERTESISWFEVKSLTRWEEPPAAANDLHELEDEDLLINWLNSASSKCQIWRFTRKETQAVGQWDRLRWGEKCDQQKTHRFVITEKGLPSFVAESTWKKKYKPHTPKILT